MADGVNAAAVAAIQGQGVAPPVLGTKAEMAPLTAAGIDLARRTMVMIGVAVLALLILLLSAETGQRADIAKTNERLSSIFEKSERPLVEPRLETVVAVFRRAAVDPLWPVPSVDEAQALIDDALKLPSLTAEDRSALEGKCIPIPAAATPDRAAVLEHCAQTLMKIFSRGEANAIKIEAMKSVQQSLAEERAAHRAFWMQVAQLILINLLLPILTALLGYIFGTQQGQKTV